MFYVRKKMSIWLSNQYLKYEISTIKKTKWEKISLEINWLISQSFTLVYFQKLSDFELRFDLNCQSLLGSAVITIHLYSKKTAIKLFSQIEIFLRDTILFYQFIFPVIAWDKLFLLTQPFLNQLKTQGELNFTGQFQKIEMEKSL